MLITTELVRDVLCIEIMSVKKSDDIHDVETQQHIQNIIDILMSNNDWHHVDIDMWNQDMDDMAVRLGEEIRREKGR